METQQTIQFGDGGSIPTSPHDLRIKEGRFSDFSFLLERYHYKGKNIGGGISYHLILEYKGMCFGGCVIGKMRHADKYGNQTVELRRMVLDPRCPPNTASYFLSKIIWWLKKNTSIEEVLSFSDLTVGHEGTCYRAANFQFVRETKPSNYVLWNGKRYHARSLTIDRPYSYEMRKAVKTGEAQILKSKPKKLYRYIINR